MSIRPGLWAASPKKGLWVPGWPTIVKGGRRLWDFENGDFGGFGSFARSGEGTAWTKARLLRAFATGIPRITDLGLLLEAGATNLFTQSDNFADTSAWYGTSVSRAGGQQDVYGGLTAVEYTANGGAGGWNRTIIGAGRATGGVSARTVFKSPDNVSFSFLFRNNTSSVNLITSIFNPMSTPSGSVVSGASWIRWAPAANGYTEVTGFCATGMNDGDLMAWYYGAAGTVVSGRKATFSAADFYTGPLSSHIITGAFQGARGADSGTIIVPEGCTDWEATYGDHRTVVSGSGLVPGSTFDIATGRPWVGLGNELKRLRFKP